jgi:hypothetical protein
VFGENCGFASVGSAMQRPVSDVPNVQPLRSVPVVQIVRGTKSKEEAIRTIREFSKYAIVVTCAGLSRAMHREFEQAGGTYARRESSEAYGCEFAQENEKHEPMAEISCNC